MPLCTYSFNYYNIRVLFVTACPNILRFLTFLEYNYLYMFQKVVETQNICNYTSLQH